MKPGLEVFEFTEEDELLEFTAGKYGLKYAHQSDPADNSCAVSCVSKYDLLRFEELGETNRMNSVSDDQITFDSTSRNCVGFEMKNVDFEDPTCSSQSPLNNEFGIDVQIGLTCTLTPAIRVDSETHAKMEKEVFLTTCLDSVVFPEEADFPATVDSSHVPVPKEDCVSVPVDYLVYRDEYCSACVVIFTSNGIEINFSRLDNPDEVIKIERSLDEIDRIQLKQLRQFNYVMVTLKKSPEESAFPGNKISELEFAVVDPDWSKTLVEITNLNVKFTALWTAAADEDTAMNDESSFRKPYFPRFEDTFDDVIYPKGESDAVSISKRDADLLQPETFINDTIIDFYIKYLKNQIPLEERNRFHFFNSFFFRKLADLDKDPSNIYDGRAAFLRVKKWTRKVDLFAKDFVFVPVNFNLHWSLLVFCHLDEIVSFNDAERQSTSKIPCILHMDSFRGTHSGLKNLVQSYLWEEWKGRHEEAADDLSSKFMNLRFVPLELPQQENLYDCGLFLLHYLEQFLSEAPLNFNPFAINEDSNFASLKRVLIQRLISTLLEIRSDEAIQNVEEKSPIEMDSSLQVPADPGLVLKDLFDSKDPCSSAFHDDNGFVFCGLKEEELSVEESSLSASDDSDVGIIENFTTDDIDDQSPQWVNAALPDDRSPLRDDQDQDHDQDHHHDHDQEHGHDQDQDHYHYQEHDQDNDQDQHQDHDQDNDQDQHQDHDQDQHQDHDQEHDQDQHQDHDQDQHQDHDQDRDYDHDHDHDHASAKRLKPSHP